MLSIDQYAHINKLAHYNPFQKIILAFGALLCVWLTHNFAVTLWTFAFMTMLIVFFAKIPIRFYLILLLAPLSFCLLGVISILVSITPSSVLPTEALWNITIFQFNISIVYSDLQKAFQLFYTAFGSVTCLYFCILTTPMYEINQLLKKWHVPDILIELITLMYHFIFLFFDCMKKISTAQQTRLGYQRIKSSYYSFALLIVALFKEVFFRNEAMVLSMKARNIESFVIPDHFYRKKPFNRKITWMIFTYFSTTMVLCFLGGI